jgi:hypothetical protein
MVSPAAGVYPKDLERSMHAGVVERLFTPR